jgi:TPR repeat protein
MCCLYGEGVPKDRKMAVHYLRLAAAGGYQEAVEALEELEKTSVK